MDFTRRSLVAGDEIICVACGSHRRSTGTTQACAICEDERQYVPIDGQRWITPEEMTQSHHNTVTQEEPGLLSIRTVPTFAIGQRALLLATPQGNVLWDCVSLADAATIELVRAQGGLAAIAISHPHFYGAMRAWSQAFGGAPIWIHEGDRGWIPDGAPEVQTWSGATKRLLGDLTLTHVGGHFEGSQVLHWAGGAGGKGALLAGDLPNICADRSWVTFMRSYPNYIPLSLGEAEYVVAALRPLPFDRLYGWTPDRVLRSDAKRRIERSLTRHARALLGEHGVVAG